MSDSTRQPPLTGVKVLDISRVLAGPYATMVLGDLGAEVIKVERPAGGDDTRQWGPPFVGPHDRQESTYFLSANRNKQSITLDLKGSADREVLSKLLRWADVLVENFRPGVMDRLGLTSDCLQELNPRLVTLSITGFGSTGPERHRLAYDQILQGEGGLMSVTGEPGHPTKAGVPIADLTAGLYGVIGILAALCEREQSGRGQRLETSLLAGQTAIQSFQSTRYLVAGEVPAASGSHHPMVAPYGSFAASDGALILAVGNEPTWGRFAELLGLSADDPRFATNRDRVSNRELLREVIEARLTARTVADWVSTFSDHEIPVGEVKSIDKVYATEQVIEQGLIQQVEHTTLGRIRLPGPPLRFGGSPLKPAAAPPTLGEHSAALRERFGTRADTGDAA